jgi:hypothetical protein
MIGDRPGEQDRAAAGTTGFDTANTRNHPPAGPLPVTTATAAATPGEGEHPLSVNPRV